MSELNYIVEWKTKRAKGRIVDWTFGMAFVAFLVLDGKTISENFVLHILIGAAVGFALAVLSSRNHNAKGQTN